MHQLQEYFVVGVGVNGCVETNRIKPYIDAFTRTRIVRSRIQDDILNYVRCFPLQIWRVVRLGLYDPVSFSREGKNKKRASLFNNAYHERWVKIEDNIYLYANIIEASRFNSDFL